MTTNKFLLIIDDLLQTIKFLMHGMYAFHTSIMNTTHTDGKQITTFRSFNFIKTLSPIFQNFFLIGNIVESTPLRGIPFTSIASQQRFAMRAAHSNTTTVSYRLCTWHLEKRNSTFMHSRPNRIGTKTHQELENFLISVPANPALWTFFKVMTTPRAQTPILIINKNTTILHRSSL